MTTMEIDAPARPALDVDRPKSAPSQVFYRTVKINGLDIFYREAGPRDAPVILLPHGFPTSSHMFRNLIPALADEFRLIAPDYPGFGNSAMPTVDEFDYTFENLTDVVDQFTETLGLTKYSLYAQDYGGPVSFRLALKHPERVQALIVQNGNAYDEGIDNDFWAPIKAYWKQKNPESEAYIRLLAARAKATGSAARPVTTARYCGGPTGFPPSHGRAMVPPEVVPPGGEDKRRLDNQAEETVS